MSYTTKEQAAKKDLDSLRRDATRQYQKNLNSRLDRMIFKYYSSKTSFESSMPHASNVISIVQVGLNEINLYKGDIRIALSGITIDHGIINPRVWV